MENAFSSFILGFLATLMLFLLCLFFVAGIKAFYLALTRKFDKPSAPPKTEPQAPNPKRHYRKKQPVEPTPQAVRSIEIDPNTVDRIYVKKIS